MSSVNVSTLPKPVAQSTLSSTTIDLRRRGPHPNELLAALSLSAAHCLPTSRCGVECPRAASVWNVYRSRWVAAYWQALGVDVIPTVSWSDQSSFDYAFAGLEAGATVAVSSVGVRSGDVDSIRAFRDGIEQVIERLRPSTLLVYGRLRHCDGIELPPVVEYPTHWDRRRREAIDAVSVGGL